MEVETSRRKFLQGTITMSVVGATALSTNLLSSGDGQSAKPGAISFHNTKTGNGSSHEVATLCEMCVNKCAAMARVENGVVTKLNPNPMFPKSKNMLCARGNAGIQALYDPDRLKYPMIRIGEKGEGKFRRVTWDEAYNAILNGTDKFPGLKQILDEEEDNRSSMLFCAGEGMAEHTFKQFFEAFGSANWLNHSSICLQTVASGYGVTLGMYPQADLDNAEYIIIAGANRAEAIVTPDTMDAFKRTKGRGAKMICIDPRFTNTAAKSDKWLAIKPGTDLAFVLALTYVTLTEELHNKAYVEKYFNGFEEYKNSVISNNYTPEWAEPITGIKAKDIYTIAREFAAHAPKAVYYPGRRSTFAKNDFQLRRAMAIFQALHGAIDTKGGLIFGDKLDIKGHAGLAPLYERARARAIVKRTDQKGEPGYDDCAVVSGGGSWIGWRNRYLEDKMPYKVRGMFCYKHNPMMNMPNTAKTAQMLKKMELVVTIDTMPSDTVMFADVVLPECTYLERTDPVKTFGGIEPSIAVRNKVIEPMFESKPVMEILKGLTTKISKPLFEISKKYDEEVQDMIEDDGEEEVYAEFDLTLPFKHTQEELNHHAVEMYPGAAEKLHKYGVFYPNQDEYYKQLSVNEYQYYPENKKFYSVGGGKPKTPSGKIECNIESFADMGVDPMPVWRDEYNYSVPAGKFRLLSGRHAQFTQSGTVNNAMLLDLMPENFIWINKRIAQEKGIKFADMIEVSSSIGKVQLKAYPTEKIAPDQVFFIHGFGAESEELTWAYKNGGNDNTIIEDHIEPVYGAAAMHETNVEIRKV
ncbi:thiosulfate reductase [Sulfurimonas sp. CVO]|jgi:thiosulfate reductase/polysulfide reductase chain A|uniref:Thiosulfate reductase n=1 Tax=Sulfurimonas xiamenensis TaxID=2590021 RepID=A0AAJ4DNE9_9BACT|nr:MULTISPECIES: molybdopterin-dependent oxidoreductase [Sulfurimonas]QFR44152.1 thiosulfate reductase [Sulfurimonas xiamenensis]QHG92064.1 thiosulfate reductase [Sulfurimonas sp. CVO]